MGQELPGDPSRGPPGRGDPATGRALRLAELVAARLCHDISGALSTVTNAIDLAGEDSSPDGGARAEALGLATEASASLGQRLRLLRTAWAEAGDATHIATLLGLAQGLPAARRLVFDGSAVRGDIRFRPGAARLMLNLVMLAAESLPAGGRVALAGHPAREIVTRIDGPRAAWPAGFATCLQDEDAAWRALDDPRTLLGPLVVLLACAEGARLSFQPSASAAPPSLMVRLA